MDITTILGIIIGVILIVYGIEIDNLKNFVDIPSILITVGGTFSAILSCFPFSMLKQMLKHPMILMRGKKYKPEPLIEQLVELAQTARKEGLLALEEKADEIEDPFFRQGIMLVVDATDADRIREMMENEIDVMSDRHQKYISIYEKASALAPAFGMIGTLVGLVNLLKGLDMSASDNSALGQNMSVALITTFYGCVLANVFFVPIAKKLSLRDEEEVLYRQMIVEGILSIQAGDNPKFLREKLAAFLSDISQKRLLESEPGVSEGSAKDRKKQNKRKR